MLRLPGNRRKLKVAALALAIAALFYPFDRVDVPEWKTLHVDQLDQPLKGMKVQQNWLNATLDDAYQRPHTADAFTDQDGIVVFPERHIRAPTIMRVVGPVLNFLSTGIHADYGPVSQIDPFCRLSEVGTTRATYSGRDLQYKIVYYYFESEYDLWPKPRPAECDAIEAQVKEADAAK